MSAIIRAMGIRARRLRAVRDGSAAARILLLELYSSSKAMEENMSPDRVYRVTDPKSNLKGSLSVLRGSDGGTSALDVELRNASEDHEVVLNVNTQMSAFIMLTVTDERGTVLSKPAKRFNSSEVQRFDTVRIARTSSHRWRVPIAAQLDASAIPEHGMRGRLVVNVALLFSKVSGEEQPADAGFTISVLTLYDMDILFTQAALSEDTKPPNAVR
jgi:hypothetical protein